MIHYYIILVLIALASGLVGFYATRIIMNTNAYITQIKHKRKQALRNMIKEEIKNVLLELKNEQ
jgi:Na+-translocating ferredoxin:NAD+ oxidoreductase RnfG subunit